MIECIVSLRLSLQKLGLSLQIAKDAWTHFKNEWKLEPDDLWFRFGTDNKGPYRYDGESLYPQAFTKPDLADEFFSKYPNAPYNPFVFTPYI